MSAEVYLASSIDPPADGGFFQGYCFVGSDFVVGDGGARAYREATGRSVGPDEDGCYVSVAAEGDEFVFRTDHYGYKKVFYLHDNGFWAVSNSIYRLVEHLRAQNRPIRPNYGQLAATSGTGAALAQLTSFATPVQGVTLLPLGMQLRIGPRGARVEPIPPPPPGPATYEDALERFLRIWITRLMTLMSRGGTVLAADLSGGLDTRSVLGLLRLASARVGEAGSPPRYRSGTAPRKSKDLRIAQAIADRLDFPLNDEVPVRERRVDSFALWRDLNLGVYHRMRFPTQGLDPRRVAVGGAGAGSHRPVYAKHVAIPSPESLVGACSRHVRPAFLVDQFERELTASMRVVEDGSPGDLDPRLLHYRHFRNRFHAGCAAQQGIKIVPLGSRLLEDCTALAGRRRVETAQQFYDIMASTVPELLDVPFDRAEKAPSRSVREALTSLRLDDDLAPGTFHVGPVEPEPDGVDRWEQPIDRLQKEFDAAVSMPFVEAFCPPETIAQAEKVLGRIVERHPKAKAAHTQPICAVLSAAMVHP